MFVAEITCMHNANYTKSFWWVDKDKNPISLTGATLRAWIKKRSDSQDYVEISTNNGKIVVDSVETNKFTITIPANSLFPTITYDGKVKIDSPYLFDLIKVNGPTDRDLLIKGTISVERGVTE